jgi:NNP family nitrate/nitrite transporter-like MFS transporter
MESDAKGLPLSSQVGALSFLTTIFLFNFLSRVVLAPLMPTIEDDLGINHGEAGFLFLIISLGYCAGLLGSGFVSSRVTHRWAIVFSAIAVGGGLLLVAFSKSLWMIRIGLAVTGIPGGFYLPSGIAIITSLVRSNDWGKAIAIHEIAPNFGFVAAPLLAEALLGLCSWRGVLVVCGVASVVLGMAFIRYGKGGSFSGEAPKPATVRILLGELSIWIMMILFSMGIGATLGVYTMIPLYLVAERGMERNWANALVAFSRVSGLVVAFISGWITDRLGPKQVLVGSFIATGTMTIILGLSSGSWLSISIILQAMIAACFFPAGFAALSRIGSSSARSVSVSLVLPVAIFLGGGAIPAGIGVIGEAGSFATGIALLGGVFTVGSILVKYLHFSTEPLVPIGQSSKVGQ